MKRRRFLGILPALAATAAGVKSKEAGPVSPTTAPVAAPLIDGMKDGQSIKPMFVSVELPYGMTDVHNRTETPIPKGAPILVDDRGRVRASIDPDSRILGEVRQVMGKPFLDLTCIPWEKIL